MIEILRVTAAFGIKGAVRVFLYTDNIDNYKKLYSEDGREFSFRVLNRTKASNVVVIKFSDIDDRNSAEKLKGSVFYVSREDLPNLHDNQFYVCDLIGQKVCVIGDDIDLTIIDVKNFGAGDLIEVSENTDHPKDSFFIPFTKENFPETNGRIQITSETYNNFRT